MKKLILTVFTFGTILTVYGQAPDTIYSTIFPHGIITPHIETNMIGTYRFSPIDNISLNMVLAGNEVKSIHYGNGKIFENEAYKEPDIISFPTDNKTGKILISGVLEFKNMPLKKLFDAVRAVSKNLYELSLIKVELYAEDKDEFTFQRFHGITLAKWGGDKYYINFELLVEFKDNKIRYEYTDFVSSLTKQRPMIGASSGDSFGGTFWAFPPSVKIYRKTLDQRYGDGERRDERKNFWTPIHDNITGSIASIKKACESSVGEKKSDW